ncbi:hypothetical protein TrVGV298_000651 [Trichoderma virens]|nr:hypothetical protein TrVGV298_000651 [Trichoderma virens]
MPLTGHCLCKAVTYTAAVDAPIITGYDHCDDCQRQSGSTYCMHTPRIATMLDSSMRKANSFLQLSLPSSPRPLSPSTDPSRSGPAPPPLETPSTDSSAPSADLPSPTTPMVPPEIIALKAGTLDTEIKKTLKPDTEIWTAGKLPFCQEKLANAFEFMP